jgi:hypothetical protein
LLFAGRDLPEHHQPRRLEQTLGAKWLLDERFAGLELLDAGEQGVGKTRDVQHVHLRVRLAHRGGQLAAIHARHHQIGNQQIDAARSWLLKETQRRLA